jgi:hypothetical protein
MHTPAPSLDDRPGWFYRAVRDAPGLSARARLLGFVLATYARAATGEAFPQQATLAKAAGVGLRTVTRALGELAAAGVIASKRGRYGCTYAFQMRHRAGVSDAPEIRHHAGVSDAPEIRQYGAPDAPPVDAPDAPPVAHRTKDRTRNLTKARLPARPARATKPRKPDPFPRPEGVAAEVWRDFLKCRARKRLSNTPTAHKHLLAALARLACDEWPPGRLVEHAAAKGWGGIYDPREGNGLAGHGRYSGSSAGVVDPLAEAARNARREAEQEDRAERENQIFDFGPRLALPAD